MSRSPARKERRRPRRSRPRATTIPLVKLSRRRDRAQRAQRALVALEPPPGLSRPTIREQCIGTARPCLWVSCEWHTYLDVSPETGSLKLNFPEIEPGEMKHSCVLDLCSQGGMTLREVGEVMNLTRERIRQVEVKAAMKLRLTITQTELSLPGDE